MLGEHCGYFQVKDVVSAADTTPVPPGSGHVPLADCGELLRSWSGWVSLEWERAWYPTIEPVSAALEAAASWFRRWAPE